MQKPTQTLPENYIVKGTLDIRKDRKAAGVLSVAGIVLFFVFGGLFSYAIVQMRPLASRQMASINLASLGEVLLAIVVALGVNLVMVVLHEAVHGVFFWLFTGSRPQFAFKLWYAYASAPGWYLPRNLYFITGVAPLVALTALGLALAAFAPAWMLLPLLLFITLNASGAVGDIAVAAWLLLQPAGCLANDRGDAVTLYVPAT